MRISQEKSALEEDGSWGAAVAKERERERKKESQLVLQYSRAAQMKKILSSSAVWMLEDYRLISPWVLQLTLLLNGLRLSCRQHTACQRWLHPVLCGCRHGAVGIERQIQVTYKKKYILCEGERTNKKELQPLSRKQLTMNSHASAANYHTVPTFPFLIS